MCTLFLVRQQHAVARLPSLISLHRRFASTTETPKPKSSHAQLYSNTWPAMIPIFLLGSAVYLGLQLTQMKLAHEKYMEEAESRINELESEITALEEQRAQQISNPAPTLVSASPRRWW